MTKFSLIKKDQTFIGVLNPIIIKSKLDKLIEKILNFFLWNYYQELQELNLWIYYHLKQILLAIRL